MSCYGIPEARAREHVWFWRNHRDRMTCGVCGKEVYVLDDGRQPFLYEHEEDGLVYRGPLEDAYRWACPGRDL